MANFLSYGLDGVDMSRLPYWSYSQDRYAANRIDLWNFVGDRVTYFGEFAGSPIDRTQGTLTAIQYSHVLHFIEFDITGFSMDARFAFDVIASGRSQSVLPNILAGHDNIVGSASNDVLFGYSGNDRIVSKAGSDYIDGGSGFDSVVFQRPMASYQIQRLGPLSFEVIYQRDRSRLENVERAEFADGTKSLLDIGVESTAAPPSQGAAIYRYAKLSNGAYFYTANEQERATISMNYPDFRFEGGVFFGSTAPAAGYVGVSRFANTSNGNYFYTANSAERDLVLSDYPGYRYEGVVFFVPTVSSASTLPVYRLANLSTGGYLFTASVVERNAAIELGFRDEGVAFQSMTGRRTAADGGGDSIASREVESIEPTDYSLVSEPNLSWSDWLF